MTFAVGDCVRRRQGYGLHGYVLSVTPIPNGWPDDIEVEWYDPHTAPYKTRLYADALTLISAEREGDNPVEFT